MGKGGVEMKKSKMKDVTMEVTVGTFMFMVLLVLAIFTIILSRENLFQKTYHLHVVFDSVMGLREGDNVLVRGVDIGKIKSIQLEDDGVHVIANLDRPMKLHKDYKVEILASSVLGGQYMSIYEGSAASPLLPESTDPVRGSTPVDLMVQASRTVSMINKALDEGGILKNLQDVMTQLRQVTSKLSEGEGTLGKLLMDDDVYNDIQQISGNLKTVTDDLAQGEGTIGKLLKDDKVYNDLEDIAANLKVVSQNLAEGKGTLGKLMSSDDQLYNDLTSAVDSIKEIALTIKDGRGTLGKLVNDDELYNELLNLLNDAQAAIDDFREASPITTFSGIFFGAF